MKLKEKFSQDGPTRKDFEGATPEEKFHNASVHFAAKMAAKDPLLRDQGILQNPEGRQKLKEMRAERLEDAESKIKQRPLFPAASPEFEAATFDFSDDEYAQEQRVYTREELKALVNPDTGKIDPEYKNYCSLEVDMSIGLWNYILRREIGRGFSALGFSPRAKKIRRGIIAALAEIAVDAPSEIWEVVALRVLSKDVSRAVSRLACESASSLKVQAFAVALACTYARSREYRSNPRRSHSASSSSSGGGGDGGDDSGGSDPEPPAATLCRQTYFPSFDVDPHHNTTPIVASSEKGWC